MSIDNIGQIVGYVVSGSQRAMLFDPSGGGNNIDLGTLIDPVANWTLTRAECMNDDGWIGGHGTNPFGYEHAFLLTPIPEPTTPLLLGPCFRRGDNLWRGCVDKKTLNYILLDQTSLM
jgi:hypothetical protein